MTSVRYWTPSILAWNIHREREHLHHLIPNVTCSSTLVLPVPIMRHKHDLSSSISPDSTFSNPDDTEFSTPGSNSIPSKSMLSAFIPLHHNRNLSYPHISSSPPIISTFSPAPSANFPVTNLPSQFSVPHKHFNVCSSSAS
jgi:hypothetical protein